MNLTTSYLGIELEHPFVVGASPLTADLDSARRLEDAGAAALVLPSLFEEQIVGEQVASEIYLDATSLAYAESAFLQPPLETWAIGPDGYYEHVAALKRAVDVPVVASLNGTTLGYWLRTAAFLESAGADALELNVYRLATDPARGADEIEHEAIEMVRAMRDAVRIPIAVKLCPFYTSLAHFGERLVGAGADGLVLFNRFYQPDFDVEKLEVARTLRYSDSSELLLRLHWLAILHGRLRCSLAASGGVHQPVDAVKAILAGADAVQLVSALIVDGPQALHRVKEGFVEWLAGHDYVSLEELRGALSLERCESPEIYERANYVRLLQR
ncbi:MAG TPA: dihydroorotate dehydrogenase-like protein [Thermoanaerobaculia bacterium]|nr:dihydroorotate dehydrogenase-like protein [Thermoanaerobaculia bacterium]